MKGIDDPTYLLADEWQFPKAFTGMKKFINNGRIHTFNVRSLQGTKRPLNVNSWTPQAMNWANEAIIHEGQNLNYLSQENNIHTHS